MSLKKFITDMLNIDVNIIESIESLETNNDSITVLITLNRSLYDCPICQKPLKVHGYTNRKLIHSTLANRKCIITYRQRRLKCSTCEMTFSEKNPFGEQKENLTYETKINILKDLKYHASTYTCVAARYNVSPTQVLRLFDKHVNISRKVLPEVLSIDEHYFPTSNYDSIYICVLMNFCTGELVDVLPDRKNDYLKKYFNDIKNQTFNMSNHSSELDNVKYVSIDLYDNYRDIAKLFFPTAVICADSFHVLENLTRLFRAVRLRCRKTTEDENMKYLLTKFKYVFHHNTNLDNKAQYNKRFKRYLNLRQIQELIFDQFPELKLAYYLKEEYITFNETSSIEEAPNRLAQLTEAFATSNIKEYMEFYNLLVNWHTEIINSFTIYNGVRINNSYIESRNKKIETLMYNANGFVNFKRTRNRILYCVNKSDRFSL